MPANVLYAETVVADVITALEGISVTSGYNNTIASVARYDRDDGPEGQRPSARVSLGSMALTPNEPTLEAYLITQPITIDLRLEPGVHDVAHDVALSYLMADVLKALSAIDYETKIYQLTSIAVDPYLTAESGDLVDFARITATFSWSSDIDDLTTALE